MLGFLSKVLSVITTRNQKIYDRDYTTAHWSVPDLVEEKK